MKIKISLLIFLLFSISAEADCFSDHECGTGAKCVSAKGDLNLSGICVLEFRSRDTPSTKVDDCYANKQMICLDRKDFFDTKKLTGDDDFEALKEEDAQTSVKQVESCATDKECSKETSCYKRKGQKFGVCVKQAGIQ